MVSTRYVGEATMENRSVPSTLQPLAPFLAPPSSSPWRSGDGRFSQPQLVKTLLSGAQLGDLLQMTHGLFQEFPSEKKEHSHLFDFLEYEQHVPVICISAIFNMFHF